MDRSYYSSSIADFISSDPDAILGILAARNEFALEIESRSAWQQEIGILKQALPRYRGRIYFEYSIPRMGKRIDVLLVIQNVIFILEFKAGEAEHTSYGIDQVWDYVLDLKNFHETSHDAFIVPILIATRAKAKPVILQETLHNDDLLYPIRCNPATLATAIDNCLDYSDKEPIDIFFVVNGEW